MSIVTVAMIAVGALSIPPERPSAARQPSAFRGASSGSSSQPSAGVVQIPDCFIYLLEDVQVPALEAGAIKELTVTEGAVVRKGEPLAVLDDREPLVRKLKAELERDAALTKASDDVEIRFAQASLAYSTAELNRLLSIERKAQNTVSGTELEKAKLARQRDELQIEKAKLDLKVAKMTADVHQAEVDAVELALARREIISPVDGEVVTVFHERQEWVNAGEPVVQVVRMDRLRVEGFVLSSEVNVGVAFSARGERPPPVIAPAVATRRPFKTDSAILAIHSPFLAMHVACRNHAGQSAIEVTCKGHVTQ